MLSILRTGMPEDHPYYRSSTEHYQEYLHQCGLKTIRVGKQHFCWMKSIFWGLVQIVKYERVDETPDIELLRKHGFKRGVIIWIPWRRTDIPKGWRSLWLPTHITTTGFATVESEDYHKKWSERARRARKKFLSFDDIDIREVSLEEFVAAFRATKVRHSHRSTYIEYYSKMKKLAGENLHSWVCYKGETPLSGLAVLNYNDNSSAHLVAFLKSEAKQYQAGTGLVDHWFSESLKNGIKYINFDHLKDKYMSRDQKGYTDFKKNFMDFQCVYPDSYFKFVGRKKRAK